MSENIVINKLPSPTWSWLKMNKTQISVPENLETMEPETRGLTDNIIYKKNYSENINTQAVSGIGKDFDSLFKNQDSLYIEAKKNKDSKVPIILDYKFLDNKNFSTKQIIHADEGSNITVIINSSSEKESYGFHHLKTKLYAEKNSSIHLIKIQTLGNSFVQIDDTESFCEEKANINVTHIILGGEKTFLGVGNNLNGYNSTFHSDCAYLCEKEQILDMNYVVLQYGKKTDCQMFVNGTLRDNAKKIYRGTIDFKNGCAGSTGNEQEETLILSPKVVNDSIPVILCDEEDVAGEHGASMGRLSEDMLFYMQSRGISKNAAENIIAKAKIQSLLNTINDEKTVTEVTEFMNSLFDKD